jgi:hypothetical protein
VNYDLLNPAPLPLPKPPVIKLRKHMKTTKADHIVMAKELASICAIRWERLEHEGLFEPVKDVDVVAAIHECIEVLTDWEWLQALADKLKQEYNPIFEPIPHVDRLPTDVVCEIQMKNAYKSLSKCSYSSPHKYCDTWSILIQKHLDAGCIHPSNSFFASLAFLILKANRSALPHWVNNFCELNEKHCA